MRTTVTLEDDLYVLLEKYRAERGESFKDALNEVVRAGLHLDMVQVSARTMGEFEVRPLSLGHCRLENMDNIGEVLAFAEGEDYK